MLRHLRILFLPAILIISFSACNSLPEHAQLIPGDAMAVMSVNTKELGKKIAWSALTGSQLFKGLQNKLPGNALVNDLGDAGIKSMSVSYVYVKGIAGEADDNEITALIPLENTGKWEAYLKKVFPAAAVKEADKRKEANLGNGVYAGWNNNLLILVYVTKSAPVAVQPSADTETDTAEGSETDTAADNPIVQPQAPPEVTGTELAAALDGAFKVTKEHSLVQDRRFKNLQEADHALGLWVNYETMMLEKKSRMDGMTGGISLPNSMWKNAALAAGVDFEKGRITGDMLYYSPDALKETSKLLGSISADKGMIDRLPADNLNAILAMHLEPAGIRGILDKVGVLGFINLALSGNGLSVDDILEAFTGDMALSLNGLTVKQADPALQDTTSSENYYSTSRHHIDFVYSLKINNKEKFNTLLKMALKDSMAKDAGNNTYVLKAAPDDSLLLVQDGNYLVISSSTKTARAFLDESFKGKELPRAAREVYNHPFGAYIDFQSIFKGLESRPPRAFMDSVGLAESKKLFENFLLKGGDYKDNAISYHMDMNFMNKEENSLMQLMDFAMKMDEAKEQQKKVDQASGGQASGLSQQSMPAL